MRVALLSYNARAGDAIGNQVAEKLTFFRDRGADVRVFLQAADRLHPVVASQYELLEPQPERAAWQFLSSADLVCVEFGHFYPLLGFLPLLSRGKTRIIVDYHGITPPELWSAHNREVVYKGLEHRGLVWHADRVLVHSRFAERELQEATRIPRERIGRIGLPVDLDAFQPAVADSVLRQRLTLQEAAVLLYVGRLAPNKRVHVLVEALGRLRDRRPAVHLLIVGDTSDLYEVEAEKCRRLAVELGVADRLHFLGHLPDDELRGAYRSADLFVTASRWEGFCVPVIEAMASGLPVIAARAGALPETLGDAGITFHPDDGADLAHNIDRILRNRGSKGTLPPAKIAVVACRYGPEIVGGAEWSLRRIAKTLHDAGHAVEIFTTCNRAEARWANELPPGASNDDGIPVHRFPIDGHDRLSHLQTIQAIDQADGEVTPETETDYLAHSLHSSNLIEALTRRQDEFSAVIVGPYLFGLTADVARQYPSKTLLLPCFHDEPLARLKVWTTLYRDVAGILYHSAEEQDFAQANLGLNHPGANVIGTCIDVPRVAATHSGALTHSLGQYVVYCGRYSPQKEIPRLLQYAERYHDVHPGRFTFVFMGRGDVSIPDKPWAVDLGFVEDSCKAEVLRDADALVLLSDRESLSLVALEAWAQETPVIASAQCAVLAGHVSRSNAGRVISNYAEFADALDDVWEKPEDWRKRGQCGRKYVEEHYGSADKLQTRLREALIEMKHSLRDRMRQRGLRRAAEFSRANWQEAFATIVDQALHAAPRSGKSRLEVAPWRQQYRARPGADLLCSVRVNNLGDEPAWAEGPGRTFLCAKVADEVRQTPLPGLLLPGQHLPAVIATSVPALPGRYDIALSCETIADSRGRQGECENTVVELRVETTTADDGPCAPLLDGVQALLARVERLQTLPENYLDVTEGWFASLKRWLKKKFLNNFKTAYVDVLSRQQSQVNRELLTAVQQLAECCATLDHAVRVLSEKPLAASRPEHVEHAHCPAGQRVE